MDPSVYSIIGFTLTVIANIISTFFTTFVLFT
jgi:hypothetical protein